MRWGRSVTAVAAGVVLLAVGATNVPPTSAAWRDDEWTVADGVGVLDCAAPEGLVETTGTGRMLSGSLLGLDLDTVAAVEGVTVEGDGSTATPYPPTASQVPGTQDAWADPLRVGLLDDALALELGGLSDALQLPLDTPVGVVGQYGQATTGGVATGAAGTVTDTGVIATQDEGHVYPDVAHLGLKTLVSSLDPTLAEGLAGVTDVSLDVGAVGARATVDGCQAAFTAFDTAMAARSVTREYMVADVGTTVDSPAVDGLVSGVTGVVDTLEATVNGLASDEGVVNGLVGGITGLLAGVPLVNSIAKADVTLAATIDLSAVRNLLNQPFGDEAGVVRVHPAEGTVRVSAAALLAKAYPDRTSAGLNGLPPNTEPLKDPVVLSTLVGVLGDVLNAWLANLQTRLDEARNLVRVRVVADVDVSLLLLPLLGLDIELDASLGALLAGQVKANVVPSLLGLGLDILSPILNPLVNGLGLLVGNLVDGVLSALPTVVDVAVSLVQELVTVVTNVYTTLYLDGVVSLTFNAQNVPVVDGVPNEVPGDLAALPPGRFDVAALRIGVLDALGDLGVRVYLARGSVGPVCAVGWCR